MDLTGWNDPAEIELGLKINNLLIYSRSLPADSLEAHNVLMEILNLNNAILDSFATRMTKIEEKRKRQEAEFEELKHRAIICIPESAEDADEELHIIASLSACLPITGPRNADQD